MLVLASASPRRKEILKNLGYEFECLPVDIDETIQNGVLPETAVSGLAQKKAAAALKLRPDCVVIGSDTVVVLDGKILGKPRDRDHAFQMLKSLSGRVHTVYTAVAIMSESKNEVFCSNTDVEFYPLTDEEIKEYIDTKEPMDKAGAYGIQGKGMTLVKRISGDFYTVVGLPAAETARRLREFGF
ncbi:MAG TPA: septum formation inhibitor Maf [Clostridiales bacterium]|nr:septum formation inhibitor Maf [Clostridiales bacterium]